MDTEQIRAVVVELVLGMDGVAGQVPATASFEELGIDSMSTMDLLRKVEDEFGIEVPDEQLPMIVGIEDLVNFVASAKQEVSR
ncbi:MAG TPA: phosphopantetheine-binding protein [Streptosporangiaceae bacterium]